jgi:hypothetical protein
VQSDDVAGGRKKGDMPEVLRKAKELTGSL